jgi:hypothetical protein
LKFIFLSKYKILLKNEKVPEGTLKSPPPPHAQQSTRAVCKYIKKTPSRDKLPHRLLFAAVDYNTTKQPLPKASGHSQQWLADAGLPKVIVAIVVEEGERSIALPELSH